MIGTAVVILVAPILAHAAAAPEHGATIGVGGTGAAFDASARQMPALSDMSEEEARSIWVWLKAVATHPLAPYAPK